MEILGGVFFVHTTCGTWFVQDRLGYHKWNQKQSVVDVLAGIPSLKVIDTNPPQESPLKSPRRFSWFSASNYQEKLPAHNKHVNSVDFQRYFPKCITCFLFFLKFRCVLPRNDNKPVSLIDVEVPETLRLGWAVEPWVEWLWSDWGLQNRIHWCPVYQWTAG